MRRYEGETVDGVLWTGYHMESILKPAFAAYSGNEKLVNGRDWAQEYYRVDFTTYNWHENYVWEMNFAIEHENDHLKLKNLKNGSSAISKGGWLNELGKLLYIYAENKLIISYDDFDKLQEKADLICRAILNNEKIPHRNPQSIFVLLGPCHSGSFKSQTINKVRSLLREL